MALRPILVAPHPVLKAKAQPVETVDAELRQMMDDMLETMYDAPGIGLAAPQIGVGSRVIVFDVAKEDEPKAPMAMINPELVWVSDEDASYEEGCLSVPEHYAEMLEVQIYDGAGWRNNVRTMLYQGRAIGDTTVNEISAAVPALVKALFTHFPGNSGSTERINVPMAPTADQRGAM